MTASSRGGGGSARVPCATNDVVTSGVADYGDSESDGSFGKILD